MTKMDVDVKGRNGVQRSERKNEVSKEFVSPSNETMSVNVGPSRPVNYGDLDWKLVTPTFRYLFMVSER